MPDPGLRIAHILELVAESFDVPVDQLRRRGTHNNRPRDAALWLCHSSAHLSYDEIATHFGVSSSAIRERVRFSEDLLNDHKAAFRDVLSEL